ncbi:MAG: type I secretion system permease/ATPase, partial [Proteobacteria bacterium]|nr:type I secretion system permease/ATPase [Pseudomonadota bacterium]
LEKLPLPALAELGEGRFCVLAGARGDQVVVSEPPNGDTTTQPAEEFTTRWTGRLVFAVGREAETVAPKRFGWSWFVPALLRYRRLILEVLAASFFLQLLALATPLFFQLVIDKVLVHRGLTTLHVLVIGLAGVSVFEIVLEFLRTWVFSHTASKVDVVLGARLFRHLLSLPVAYFQTRATGQTVARVRELETIREFLTGSSLTLLIDGFFVFVFIAVLFLYRPLLSWQVVGTLPLYAGVSLALTPARRRRVEERFQRSAVNHGFLVEAVAGAETLKATAVEPQMQRRWEERLAAYVVASLRATRLGLGLN